MAGGILLGEFRGVFTGALAEHQQIGERVAAQAIGAMQPGAAFTRGKQAGNIGHLRIGIDAHAAHHVVSGGADFHRDLR